MGKDFETVFVNGKAYIINPPTIHRIAGAGFYLSDISEVETVSDMLRSLKDLNKASNALSFLICGDIKLGNELSDGSLDEVVEALEVGLSMISAENFYKLSVLSRNVAALTAKQK